MTGRVGEHTPAALRTTASVLVRTVEDARRDDLMGEAAKVAYYFLLSLFPLVIVIFTATGIVGGDAAFARIVDTAETLVPDTAWSFVRGVIREVTTHRRPGLFSFGLLFTLWAASNAIAALMSALNTIFDIRDERSWWYRHLLSLGVLLAGLVLVVAAGVLLIPSIGWLQDAGLSDAWRFARWPIGVLALVGTLWLALAYLPARDRRLAGVETVIGAAAATGAWLLVSWLFRFYVTHFSRYGTTYGTLGAVIIALMWFYITALAVLSGGELAAVLEQRHRRAPRRATADLHGSAVGSA